MQNKKLKDYGNVNSLKRINIQFYKLIKNLKTGGFENTSQIAKFAYEYFLEELNKRLS